MKDVELGEPGVAGTFTGMKALSTYPAVLVVEKLTTCQNTY